MHTVIFSWCNTSNLQKVPGAFDWRSRRRNRVITQSTWPMPDKSQWIHTVLFTAAGAPGAMKLMRGCLLAVALLSCLAGAQYPEQIPQQRPPLPEQRPPQVARTPWRIPDRHATYPERRRVLERPPRFPERPQTFSQTSSQSPQFPRPHPSDRPLPDRMQHCFVSEDDRITCGAPGITGPDCEDINCCFDGSRCYYGKLGKSSHKSFQN